MYGSDGWHMGGMWLWWVLLIVAAVVGVWVLVSRAHGRRGGGESGSPEEELKRRYAKGEIDRETYERMLSDLRK